MSWDRRDGRRWKLYIPGRVPVRARVSLHAGSVEAALWIDGHLVYCEWSPSSGGMGRAAGEIDSMLEGLADAIRRGL